MLPRVATALLTALVLSGSCQGAACEGAEAEVPIRRAAEFRSDEVDATLEAAAEVIRTRGFSDQSETPWRGFLVDRAAAVDQVRMGRGNCYVVLAATSEGLRALAVSLHDSDGAEVARSEADTGAVRYCPPQTGTYFVAVHADGSGLFAVRRFEGPTGLEIRLDDLVGEARP